MARFFSVLSGSEPSALTSDFFDQRSISDGINKRNGLIASRSIVSADVYEDLDAVNIDGSLGTYFPPDLLTAPNNPFTGTAYTSSIPGIVIPNDYRTRPTASILSTTAGVGETNPLDTVSVSFTSYLAASTAVKTVLDSITDGGPYGRIGLNASRTLHGLHHDQELGYFAWDDFTPGKPVTPSIVDPIGGGGTITIVVNVDNSPTQPGVFLNDRNPSSTFTAVVSIDGSGCGNAGAGNAMLHAIHYPDSRLVQGTNSSGNGPANPVGVGTSTWAWDKDARTLTWNLVVNANKEYTITAFTQYFDVTIPINASENSTGATKTCVTTPA